MSEYQKKLDFIKNNFEIFFNFESVEDNIASKMKGEIKKDIYEIVDASLKPNNLSGIRK